MFLSRGFFTYTELGYSGTHRQQISPVTNFLLSARKIVIALWIKGLPINEKHCCTAKWFMIASNKTMKGEACSNTEVFYLTLTFTLRLLAAITHIHRDPFTWLKSEDILKVIHLLYTGLTLTVFNWNIQKKYKQQEWRSASLYLYGSDKVCQAPCTLLEFQSLTCVQKQNSIYIYNIIWGAGMPQWGPYTNELWVVKVQKHAFIRDVHVCMHMASYFCIIVQLYLLRTKCRQWPTWLCWGNTYLSILVQ